MNTCSVYVLHYLHIKYKCFIIDQIEFLWQKCILLQYDGAANPNTEKSIERHSIVYR